MTPNRDIARLGGKGILTEEDIPSLTQAQDRIVRRMSDELWHSATEIIGVSGQREGLRRLRDLRSKGYTIERQRRRDSREFYYRLTKP